MRSPRRRASAAALATLLPLLAGCTTSGAPADPAAPGAQGSSSAPVGMDESLREEALELIDRREAALVAGDRAAFLATVNSDELGFSATQARWFDNLAKLPVSDVSIELGDESDMTRVHGEGGLQLPVEITMRLSGFDERPVTQPMIYTFDRNDGEVVLSNDRNIQSDAHHGWLPAPWDITRIHVRRAGPILGIFDEETLPYSDGVMDDLQDARAAIREHIPSWSGRFVAYDITDLQAMDKMSQMETWDTGGVAFPVLTHPESRKVASYRFMVNPDVADSAPQRAFLFRHELVHVALGTSDDDSPVWLVEGVAEYVSRAQLPLATRQRVSASVLATAGPGTLALRAGVDFYRREPTLSYELANLVCDYLASTRGPDVLFDLIEAFDGTRSATTGDVDRVVRNELGIGTRELTTQALVWLRG